jgi:Tfp pilus assembly protein PilX
MIGNLKSGYLRFRFLTLEGENMGKSKRDSRGFTLIAALLLTVLLSAVAVGLIYMVNNEQRMGGNDLEGNLAYYGAESGIENLTAQLSALYQSSQSPTAASITALTAPANYPTAVTGSNITNMNYVESITWPLSNAAGNPTGDWDIVGSGPNQGMVASLIQFNLQVTATRASTAGEATNNAAITPTGASVNLTRTVEVALLPAFEFGVFCDGDCDYFAGPPFNFGGRVHANGNLFLASGGSTLTFTDKIAAVGQIITTQLENGWPTSTNYNGTVYVPTAAGGCPAAPGAGPAANCKALPSGSWAGGFPNTGAAVANWRGVSTDSPTTGVPPGFNSFIVNGLTGATALQLPFVENSKVGAIDIIRKPTPVDTALLTNSRLYSAPKAVIRILLADTEADLYPGEVRADPGQDVQLGTPNTHTNPYIAVPTVATGLTAGNMYFATAKPGASTNDWTKQAPTGCNTTLTSWPLFGQVTVAGSLCQGTWLRVEYQNAAGTWVGVTTQWLGYGFGRGYNAPPTHPYSTSTATVPYCPSYTTSSAPLASYPVGQCQNAISPAIIILQQLQQGLATSKGLETDTTDSSGTEYNWLPLNFYDAREGEPRDTRPAGDPGTDCSPNGIMNAVELDVGNLWLWLQGAAPYTAGSGTLVSPAIIANNNGYILYFADHRGMLQDKYPLSTFYNNFSGMSGLNDTVNGSSSIGLPDGALEPITYYATAPTPYSPEDTAVKGAAVNGGNVDKWGETNLGAGFGLTGTALSEPYYIHGSVTNNAVQCYTNVSTTPSVSPFPGTAEWNIVTGPRHVLRLVDGGMDSAGNSYLPHPPAGQSGDGFTVGSEEPVYVWGDYNTGVADPFWPSENTTTTPHSAASIIADSVTLLSNPPFQNETPAVNPLVGWTDQESFISPATAGNRAGNTSYYRVAIAAGKSIPFPEPGWASAAALQDFGTDGGMHNFLRYLENRGANGATVNYAGSLISMYYSQYDTGVFKCCNSVYGAPNRNYFFDTQFLNPNNLPPGTPMFQDVVSLGFHQNFTPQ